MLRLFFSPLLFALLMFFTLKVCSTEQAVYVAPVEDQNIQVELFQFDNPELQKSAIRLAKSLRCPQCQNQNLVESNAPVAKDLRLIVFQKINQGQSEQEVIDFMTARYGEFVLYKPAFNLSNALLWLTPVLVLLLLIYLSVKRVKGFS